mgnify:CR=1 FL=1
MLFYLRAVGLSTPTHAHAQTPRNPYACQATYATARPGISRHPTPLISKTTQHPPASCRSASRPAYTTLYSAVSSCFFIENFTGPPRCVCSTLATATSQKVLLEVKATSTG